MAAGSKPGLLLALGVGKKPAPGAPKSEPEMDDSEAEGDDFEFAADSLLDAIESKDPEAFRSALKTAIMACMDTDYGSDEE